MNDRALRGLAWALWVLDVMLAIVSQVLVGIPDVGLPLILTTGTLGLLIVSRHPSHRIGWAFTATGVLYGLLLTALRYAERGLAEEGGPWRGAVTAAWVSDWSWVLPVALLTFVIPLLFPNGRALSRSWRWVLVGGSSVFILTSVGAMFSPGAIRLGSTVIANPYAASGALGEAVRELSVNSGGAYVFIGAVALAALSLSLRYRRSRGEERLQLKWFFYGTALTVPALLAVGPLWDKPGGERIAPVVFLIIPIAAATAILRYRLYDIDVFINKTLVYGFLSALLGGGYFGSVVLLQALLRPLTQGSELAVAASTLVAAAIFRPARRGIQGFVDQRFYRQRYDAVRALESFSSRLRNEIDLESLRGEVGLVVRQTLQPTAISFWVRDAGV